MHRCGPGVDGPPDDLALLFEGLGVGLDVLDGVDAHPHREVGPGAGPDGGDHLEQQPGPVLERAAPAVVAGVARREERVDQVAVPGVQLDPVEPGPPAPLRGRGEEVDDPGDVVLGGHVVAVLGAGDHERPGLGGVLGVGHETPEAVGVRSGERGWRPGGDGPRPRRADRTRS